MATRDIDGAGRDDPDVERRAQCEGQNEKDKDLLLSHFALWDLGLDGKQPSSTY